MTHQVPFKNWYAKRSKAYPWIAHILLMMTHNLIMEYVKLGKDMDLVKEYESSTLSGYDTSVFKAPDSVFYSYRLRWKP